MTKEEKLIRFKEHIKSDAEVRALGLIGSDNYMQLTREAFLELIPTGTNGTCELIDGFVQVRTEIDGISVICCL